MYRRRRNKFDLHQTLVTSVIIVVITGISLLSIWIIRGLSKVDPAVKREEEKASQSSQAEEQSSYAEGEGDLQESSGIDENAIDTSRYSIAEFDSNALTRGDLILVNGEHEYRFDEADEFVTIYGNKNKAYMVKDALVELNQTTLDALNRMMLDFFTETGRKNVLVISGVRSYETQEDIFSARVEQMGEEETAKLTARPGHSEHHSGYAVDLNLYLQNGTAKLTNEGDYAWIYEHAAEYGFIQRYTDEKSALTGISDESWHFRYVGVPHASIMTERGYCLEEYMQYLEGFQFGVSHLNTTCPDGARYEIYYVAASSDGSATSVPLPSYGEYTVSGNNAGGFIVTVKLSESADSQSSDSEADSEDSAASGGEDSPESSDAN